MNPRPVRPFTSLFATPRRRWALAAAAALGVAGLFLAAPRLARADHRAEPPAARPVAVARVVRTDLAQEVDFEAEFRPYQEILIHAKVAGFVKAMNVDVGDQVREGQLLATLEVPELADEIAHAEAVRQRSIDQVRAAEAASEEAHLAWTRLLAVQKTQANLIAQQDLDDARTKDESAAASLAKAKHDVLVADADVERLRTMREYTQITAPFAGVITRRDADPGALIPVGTASSQATPLLRLSENDRLRLTFPVSVSYVDRIRVGQEVRIHVQATGRTLRGAVSRFTRKVETATRTMDVEVDVPNPDLALVPGMYASVTVELARKDHALAVPLAAIARKDTATVCVVTPESELKERTVSVGLETPTMVEIVSGVSEGDLVLIGSRSQVQAGQKVAPRIVDTTETIK